MSSKDDNVENVSIPEVSFVSFLLKYGLSSSMEE